LFFPFVEVCEKELGSTGRCIIRYSGTENKMRILLEAETDELVNLWSDKIASVVEKELGL